MEEKYSIEEIVEMLVQGRETFIVALEHQDREMLEDTVREYINN